MQAGVGNFKTDLKRSAATDFESINFAERQIELFEIQIILTYKRQNFENVDTLVLK